MARENGPRAKLEQARERLSPTDDHILEFSRAIDPDSSRAGPAKSVRTAGTYTNNLRRFQDRADGSLSELTTEAVIDTFDEMGDELATDSVAQYQSAVKGFYRWYDGGQVDPEGFAVTTDTQTGIDENTVLTRDEFHALRDAGGSSRARCIIDLLGYTGQRIRVIQTLRVKDVDLDSGATGVYRLNTDADGLKGAEKAMSKRPLLGAQKAVREWLSYHPTGDSEDYLITTLPSSSRGDPGSMVAQNTIRRDIKTAAEKADIDKPVNPHAFRHFFATAAKRDYEMDDETIRRLLGHGAKSRIMETTYRHLNDDDVVEDAESSYGVETEASEESRLTPPVCPTCDSPLGPRDKSCSECGTVFTLDAKQTQDEMDEQIQKEKEEAETLDEYKDADAIAQAISNDPKLASQLMDRLGDLADE